MRYRRQRKSMPGDPNLMDQLEYDFRQTLSISKDDNFGFDRVKTVLRVKAQENQSHDLFRRVRDVLIVGRFLGVIPISGVFKNSYTKLSFRKRSLAATISLTIICVLTVNLILAVIQWINAPKRNALQIAQSIHRTAQYLWGWMIYITFLIRAEKFLDLFTRWAKTSSMVFYSIEDKSLRRDSVIICGVILTSCILENAVLHLEYIKELDDFSGVKIKYQNVTTPTQSFLETYYWRSNSHWAFPLGYNGFLAVLAFIQHKWMLYTWNYLDILLAVFARALYFQFKMLYELATKHLANKEKVKDEEFSKSSPLMSKAAWIQVVADHNQLHDLLQVFEDFFSPLIFGSYAVNIYYICIQLLIGLSPEITVNNPVQLIYGPWSFFHMAIRIYIVSLCAARINLYAHEIRRIFQDCPVELYPGEIARIDKRITSGPQIGLTGLGCFVVTKPFILTIVSVIFTVEIVLLQGVSSSTPHSSNCPTEK